jgi:glycerophosphoryl diester phosphodiesterase
MPSWHDPALRGADFVEPDLVMTTLVQRAHARGLLVHTWTFRNEPRRRVDPDFARCLVGGGPFAWRCR